MLGVVVCSALAGGIISYWGYYWPFLVVGPLFCCVGGGLLYTVTEYTPMSRLIGYQIVSLSLRLRLDRSLTAIRRSLQILSMGLGFVLQNPIIAVRTWPMSTLRADPDYPALVTGPSRLR